ncbi:MAG: glycoside hydrolase family 76 protein [Bacteroidales bacterium]
MRYLIIILAFVNCIYANAQNKRARDYRDYQNDDLIRAKSTLQQILKLYDAGHDNLLYETFPYKPGNRVTYLAGDDTVTGQRVAYLWPTSGVFSAVNALLKSTGDNQYLRLLEEKILPGLDQYYDSLRKPACYQSYITLTGKSDRYYDDNVWLALDFCDLYMFTGNTGYLEKSIKIWQFVLSGWDDKLGGGIYWCEQKKNSKNTCSNAPSSVLALKLFEATRDSSYFRWGVRIYDWTKANLQDPADHLYFDNMSLTGKTDIRKYTYNSGQMLQAAVMLYILTENKIYLNEAHNIAGSAVDYFTEEFTTGSGGKIRLFKNTGTWFNSILFRGYEKLYQVDKNDQYIKIFRDNMNHLWDHVRNQDGLFSKDWKGQKEDDFKTLLDQSGLVEIWAGLAGID